MRAAGFDFGTSNSAIGIIRGNQATLAPLENGATMTPTAVFFDFTERDKPYYGRAAVDAYVNGNEGRLMRGLKTILSTNLINERTALSKRSIALTDVIAMFSRQMRLKAEEAVGEHIEAVVHGRPVRFVEGDDALDRKAEETLGNLARQAGYKDVSFVYEPVAAAAQYEQSATTEQLILVADIGCPLAANTVNVFFPVLAPETGFHLEDFFRLHLQCRRNLLRLLAGPSHGVNARVDDEAGRAETFAG